MFGVKVVPIDVINHPLQYGGKKLGHPVYTFLTVSIDTFEIHLRYI